MAVLSSLRRAAGPPEPLPESPSAAASACATLLTESALEGVVVEAVVAAEVLAVDVPVEVELLELAVGRIARIAWANAAKAASCALEEVAGVLASALADDVELVEPDEVLTRVCSASETYVDRLLPAAETVLIVASAQAALRLIRAGSVGRAEETFSPWPK
jgi:hypothetical protein